MKKFVLISKDAFCREYLPCYGNAYWHTPNIDELCEQGSLFMNHYTAAPSTVMSFYSMVTGISPHDSKFEAYERNHDVYSGKSLFSKTKELGYKNYMLWDPQWMDMYNFCDYFGDNCTVLPIDGFRQGVGSHYKHNGILKRDEELLHKNINHVQDMVKTILNKDEQVFLWIHFPHVIKGEVAYGSDIESFDSFVGFVKNIVGSDNIAITADHGNCNGHKGRICYGFDVYQPSIRIPLITPLIDKEHVILKNTSNVDLFELLFNRSIPEREFVYSDTAYKAQIDRKLAIIKGKYKYIYDKQTKKEELYDIEWDDSEQFSLMEDFVFDKDRKVMTLSRELYFYPYWDELPEVREEFRTEKNRIWETGSSRAVAKEKIKKIVGPIYHKLLRRR